MQFSIQLCIQFFGGGFSSYSLLFGASENRMQNWNKIWNFLERKIGRKIGSKNVGSWMLDGLGAGPQLVKTDTGLLNLKTDASADSDITSSRLRKMWATDIVNMNPKLPHTFHDGFSLFGHAFFETQQNLVNTDAPTHTNNINSAQPSAHSRDPHHL